MTEIKPQLLHNALIINEGRRYSGWLTIDSHGIIDRMGEGNAPEWLVGDNSLEIHDMHGHWLLPGVIDSHVHFREPGMKHKATIYTESRAAAAGGVTSYLEMPNTNPATVTLEALDEKFYRAANDSAVNYSFFIGATASNLTTLQRIDYTRVPGVKLFMGSSTGGMLVDESDSLQEIFKLPVLVMVHSEQEDIIRENMARVKELYYDAEPPLLWHPQIRSELACYSSTVRAVNLAKRFGTRLHIAHITTAQELKLLSRNPGNITGEVCVAHLLFSDDDYATLGTRIKCNPAVKSAPHREALRRGVAAGLVTTVSTDHAPHTLEEKQKGTLTAPSGMPMVQFSLPAMLDMAASGLWTPERVVEVMCHAQASLFRIERRGYLRQGYFADIVEVDPLGETVINADTIISKCGWSPLEGRTLRSKVVTTRVNGRCVYRCEAPETTGMVKCAMPLVFEGI